MAANLFDMSEFHGNDLPIDGSWASPKTDSSVPDRASLNLSLESPSSWRFVGGTPELLAGNGIEEEDLVLLHRYGRRAMQNGRLSLYLSQSAIERIKANEGLDLQKLYCITLFFDGKSRMVWAIRFTPTGDPNRIDRHIHDHVLTDHAINRLHGRGFTHDHVRAAIEHGEHFWAKGASKYVLTRRRVEAAAELGHDVSAFEGTTVVVAPSVSKDPNFGANSAAVITTIYSNNDISHTKQHRLHRTESGRYGPPRSRRGRGRGARE